MKLIAALIIGTTVIAAAPATAATYDAVRSFGPHYDTGAFRAGNIEEPFRYLLGYNVSDECVPGIYCRYDTGRPGELGVFENITNAPILGGVDKFEPVSGGGDVNRAEEAFGELVTSGCDGAVDFQTPEEAFDVIALLVERPVMLDLDPAV